MTMQRRFILRGLLGRGRPGLGWLGMQLLDALAGSASAFRSNVMSIPNLGIARAS